MWEVYAPVIVAGFVITLVELTEVVALVFALSADHHTVAHGALGAVSGITVVGVVALAFGALLLTFPRGYLLWASAVVLAGFAVFLFGSTLRSYRKSRARATEAPPESSPSRSSVQFAGGFSVGAVEATEVVVVLLAFAALGYGFSALLGAVVAAVVLVAATAVVHDRIRRIKAPWLKLGANSMLFAFAVFWAGTAAGVVWPGSDLILIPLFLLGLLLVRGAVELGLRRTPGSLAPS